MFPLFQWKPLMLTFGLIFPFLRIIIRYFPASEFSKVILFKLLTILILQRLTCTVHKPGTSQYRQRRTCHTSKQHCVRHFSRTVITMLTGNQVHHKWRWVKCVINRVVNNQAKLRGKIFWCKIPTFPVDGMNHSVVNIYFVQSTSDMYSSVHFLLFKTVTPESGILKSTKAALYTERIVTNKRQPFCFRILLVKPPNTI